MAYTQVQIHCLFKYILNHCVVCAPISWSKAAKICKLQRYNLMLGDCRTIFWGVTFILFKGPGKGLTVEKPKKSADERWKGFF